ncbi:hypothetical protein [Tepidimicrobium xylanilyticum]|uniref:hypothetical protein n=1 Tax=Tepidimicrobium xylanilyticum TaxID=1123352 RepID=UPI000B83E739|nr:hypothetical protein [Tepidimicrobium xylanilyticum]
MTIGERLRLTDINTYNRLIKLFKTEIDKPRRIDLGDSVENLMKHDSHKRVRGALRQIKWE